MVVEFLGVPRQRAGASKLVVEAKTLGELLGKLSTTVPPLSEFIAVDRLNSGAIANLNGDRFITDPNTPLRAEDCVLILSADAGG